MNKPKNVPIRQRIDACTDLSGNEKLLLGNVCIDAHYRTKSESDAKKRKGYSCIYDNGDFIKSLGWAKDTISRVLKRVEAKGYVLVEIDKQGGNKRWIYPTEKTLALYLPQPEVTELLTRFPLPELSTDTVDGEGVTLSTHPIDVAALDLSTICQHPIDFLRVALSTILPDPIDDSTIGLSTLLTDPIDDLPGTLLIVRNRIEIEIKKSNSRQLALARECEQLKKRVSELEANASLAQAQNTTPVVANKRDKKEGAGRAAATESDELAFEVFWQAYGKMVDKKKTALRWSKLSEADKRAALEHTPRYVAATPDRQYRKNPDTYLYNCCWLDDELPALSVGAGRANAPLPDAKQSSADPSKKKNWTA